MLSRCFHYEAIHRKYKDARSARYALFEVENDDLVRSKNMTNLREVWSVE